MLTRGEQQCFKPILLKKDFHLEIWGLHIVIKKKAESQQIEILSYTS